MDNRYYDGTKLLSLMDVKGLKPEIYLCTTNRSAGKTTYFSRLLVNKFLNDGSKFALIYRFNYELDDCADKFFKDIGPLFFPGLKMVSNRRASGIYHELFLDGKSCGYAISINSADTLKKYSHFFSDVERMFFDEFQSENSHYCSGEVRKLISLHTSIARGQGSFVRYVPIYMCANAVSIINPYYTALGVSERLRDDTKFLRGDGYVLEHGYVEGAAAAQMASGFNRAFAREDYVAYSAQNAYLNDNSAFIDKPKGKSRYVATLRYKGRDYGVREYPQDGVVYCDTRPDLSSPSKLSVTTSDHNINYVMLKANALFVDNLRYYFDRGCFRFQNLACKEAVLKALSY